jgi:hypothetical protein
LLSGTARDADRPATFRDVLAVREFRTIYFAATLSWFGDYAARAAITALVYQATGSAAASAAAFAITYAPWLMGGSVLVSIAERYPYRTVMVFCDVARMLLMAVVVVPNLPTPLIVLVVLAAAFFSPPFDAARSATLPSLLAGDRYVVGVALQSATGQPAMVTGYLAGAAIAVYEPRVALFVNALTFAVSALLVRFGVALREPALDRARRTDLLGETMDGFRLVFANPALRALVLVVFCGSLFVVVPEGLGAAWAAQLTDQSHRGWAQGAIMAAVPLGSIFGALLVSRFVTPGNRARILRPIAIASPIALIPALFDPHVYIVVLLAGLCGFGIGALVPIANGQFVQALPNAFRARAFGVVQGGLHLVQGGAVLLTGLLAHVMPVSIVVGVWSAVGLVLMLMLALSWPSPRAFDAAVSDAARANASTPPRHAIKDCDDEPTPPTPPTRASRWLQAAARRRGPTQTAIPGGAGAPGTMEP